LSRIYSTVSSGDFTSTAKSGATLIEPLGLLGLDLREQLAKKREEQIEAAREKGLLIKGEKPPKVAKKTPKKTAAKRSSAKASSKKGGSK